MNQYSIYSPTLHVGIICTTFDETIFTALQHPDEIRTMSYRTCSVLMFKMVCVSVLMFKMVCVLQHPRTHM